jgi:hypothetical protein
MSLILALLLVAAQDSKPPAGAPQEVPPSSARTTTAPSCTPSGRQPSHRIAELLAATNGATAATAWRVRSIREEYEILDALGLCPNVQSLTQDGGHPYDRLDAVDARTGEPRQLWFDISAFFGRGF